MKKIFLFVTMAFTITVQAQTGVERLEKLVGMWEGTGVGFGNSKSKITAEYKWIMGNQFIEMKHRSEFEPTEQNPQGEIHEDLGIISFDSAEKELVFRQYHVEGFYNEYVLNDSLSTLQKFVFETRKIENFVPGGKARFTIRIVSDSEIETVFDVGTSTLELTCYGTNHLKRKK